jgi:hypothetical protein
VSVSRLAPFQTSDTAWNKERFVCVRGIGSGNYENKFLLLFSATFSFMYDAKQNKAKQKSTDW